LNGDCARQVPDSAGLGHSSLFNFALSPNGIGSSKGRRHPVSGIKLTPSVFGRASGIFLPMEIRADIGALLAAGLAGKQRLDIGQPDVIRPAITAYLDVM
jgi:hypothetical protein